MASHNVLSAAHRGGGGSAPKNVGFGGLDNFKDSKRTARRQRLAWHVYACGPRPVFEALLAVEAGQPLGEVLTEFARLPPAVYRALGADELPVGCLSVIDGDAG